MKLKDLEINKTIIGVKVKIPKKYQSSYIGIVGKMYLYAVWKNGVWLKTDMQSDRIYPLTITPKKVCEFEVVG